MKPQEIKELRAKLGLTQEALARKVGVTLGSMVRWESARCRPSPLALEKLKKIKDEV